MNYTIESGIRTGSLTIPASKSYAHRQLICAALSQQPTKIICDGISKDIAATIACLTAMGGNISVLDEYINVNPIGTLPTEGVLPCNESGSTLRFLLPVAAAKGMNATFEMAPGLAVRPMDELISVLSEHGANVKRQADGLHVSGQLTPGEYSIRADVSSQYISGLLMALPMLEKESRLILTGTIESEDYIKMTEDTLVKFGIRFSHSDNVYVIPGNQSYVSSDIMTVERDWSNAAFFLCMGALSKQGITLKGMRPDSKQGDRAIVDILRRFGAEVITDEDTITVRRNRLVARNVDAAAIPDLIPTIAALASCCDGVTEIVNAGRLRFKESDRLKTTANMLQSLGADVAEKDDGLIITGRKSLRGGCIDACNDHRIAMAAAVAACACENELTVMGAECVQKSFSTFWELFERLEVTYE